jgi:RNase P protein component
VAGWDVIVSARAPAAQADFHELKAAVANLFVRASILAEGASGEEEQP